jgi:hypothetical protein
MKKVIFILICIITFAVTGCAKKVTGDEKIAEDFIKSQGYKITSRKGEVERYVLEKSKLKGITENLPYIGAWSVQKVEPDKYFGKEIIVYGFIVKNHPLQERDRNAKSGVRLFVMLEERKVIGGYSYPNAEVEGGLSSLEGKSLEEVTGLSYKQWAEDWNKKY